MSFHEVSFPDKLSEGSGGGPGFWTAVVRLKSGQIETKQQWASPLWSYALRLDQLSIDEITAVQVFAACRRGSAAGFRFLDRLDHATSPSGRVDLYAHNGESVSATDCQIGVGDASQVAFQLVKIYDDGGPTPLTRVITKPIAGTAVVALDGTPTTAFSLNSTTGIVTFNTPPGAGVVITAGFTFEVPVIFDEQADEALRAAIHGFDSASIPAVGLIELPSGIFVPDDFNFGGSTIHLPLTADWSLGYGHGKVQVFDPQTSGRKLYLPVADDLPTGGEHFILFNDSASNTLALRTAADVAVATIATQSSVEVYLAEDPATGDRTWYAA